MENDKHLFLTKSDGDYLDWRAKYMGMPDDFNPEEPWPFIISNEEIPKTVTLI